MIEAVYIADSKNSLVFEYLISLDSPHFKSLQSIINTKQSDSNSSIDIIPLIEINSNFFVCSHKTTNLIIYVLCSKSTSSNNNPILPFVFINRLIEVMEDYFGTPLAVTKIDANNDTLTLLMNDMIEDGIPNITDFNKLRDLIPFKSLLSKFLSTSNNLASTKSLNSLTKPMGNAELISNDHDAIPWRRSNVKYTNNEMYVDVIETINVILKPLSNKKQQLASSNKNFDSAFYSSSSLKSSQNKLVPIVGHLNGEINFLSHLTGVPYLQMLLNVKGLNIETPTFHPCIKLDKWLENEGNLSFIPPDGYSTLMNYQVDFDLFSLKSQQEMLGLVDVDFQYGLGVNQNEFEIKLFIKNHKSVSKLENLKIELKTDEFSDSINNENDSDSFNDAGLQDSAPTSNVTNIKANRITHGDFQYKGNGEGEWTLRNTSTDITPLFRGSIITNNFDNISNNNSSSSSINENLIDINTSTKPAVIKPSYIKLSYSNKGCVPSGLKVDGLKILSAKGLGESIKPYKGVKYITKTGDYIIRS